MCFTLAVCQLAATTDRQANRDRAVALVREAAGSGGQLICLPEMWPFIGPDAQQVEGAEDLDGPSVSAMRELARELGVWLFPGSFPERSGSEGKIHNTAVAIDDSGELRGAYRKVHLFDVDIADSAVYLESRTVLPGDRAVVVDTPWLRVGMSTCYDLRFPALYQVLRDAGAELITVPAAFTAYTGKAHWEVLLRARAIEQQVFVAAADQGGWHSSNRQSHGHSMIVGPWGDVLGQVGEGGRLALARIDPEDVRAVRSKIPCHEHRREVGTGTPH